MVATITKWWSGGEGGLSGLCIESRLGGTYVIDVTSGAIAAPQGGNVASPMSGGTRLNAIQKTALIGATLLIDFTYYQVQNESHHSTGPSM